MRIASSARLTAAGRNQGMFDPLGRMLDGACTRSSMENPHASRAPHRPTSERGKDIAAGVFNPEKPGPTSRLSRPAAQRCAMVIFGARLTSRKELIANERSRRNSRRMWCAGEALRGTLPENRAVSKQVLPVDSGLPLEAKLPGARRGRAPSPAQRL